MTSARGKEEKVKASNVVSMTPTAAKKIKVEKITGTRTDTIEVTAKVIASWEVPPFQRQVKLNARVHEVANELVHNGGVLPGILTIGKFEGKWWRVDGQHRLAAFELSQLEVAYADVRYREYDSIAEMAKDFVDLNSSLVRMKPDDMLRGLESSSEPLKTIRDMCPFVGYDNIRRRLTDPVVSMSVVLRCWNASGRDVPSASGTSVVALASELTQQSADYCIEFLNIAITAWGRDPEYAKLWGALNLTLCMWLFRQVVMKAYSTRSHRVPRETFQKLMTALSASSEFLEYLHGRNLNDRDRAPCYRRLKAIMVRRLEAEIGRKTAFPQPEWAAN